MRKYFEKSLELRWNDASYLCKKKKNREFNEKETTQRTAGCTRSPAYVAEIPEMEKRTRDLIPSTCHLLLLHRGVRSMALHRASDCSSSVFTTSYSFFVTVVGIGIRLGVRIFHG